MQPCDQLTGKETQVATLVWQGLTNREIANNIGTTEQVVKNYLRSTFDKLGVWSRLELALYVASHGGAEWRFPSVGSREHDGRSPWRLREPGQGAAGRKWALTVQVGALQKGQRAVRTDFGRVFHRLQASQGLLLLMDRQLRGTIALAILSASEQPSRRSAPFAGQ